MRELVDFYSDQDEFGRPEEIAPLLEAASPKGFLYEIPQATHMFPKQARQVATVVADACRELLELRG